MKDFTKGFPIKWEAKISEYFDKVKFVDETQNTLDGKFVDETQNTLDSEFVDETQNTLDGKKLYLF